MESAESLALSRNHIAIIAGTMIALGPGMTVRYSIHTQHCAPALVAKRFDGFTINRGCGYWQGKREDCVTIVILGSDLDLSKVLTLARDIREQYRQEEVWVTYESVELRRVSIDATKTGLSDTVHDTLHLEQVS